MKKQLLQNLLLALISTTITLILIETGFRVYTYLQDQQTLKYFEPDTSSLSNGEEISFHQTIKLSENPKIIYDLIPNLSVSFLGQTFTTSNNGFRGKYIPINKKEGTIRIVGIGDSQMFGWGVKDDETYLSILSDNLNYNSNCNWEVINTAVPGYNTVMELATLKEKGLAYQPDYVIIGFVGNDFSLPNFIRESENYFSLEKLFMVSYFKGKLEPVFLKKTPFDKENRSFIPEPSKVPPEYKDLVGEDAVVKALEELKELSDIHNFSVLLFIDNRARSFNPYQMLIFKTCDRLDIPILQGLDLWEDFAEKNNVADPNNARFLSKTDPHASAISHKATGEKLFHLISEDFLNKNEFECLSD